MALFQGCSGKLLDGISVLLREIQALFYFTPYLLICFLPTNVLINVLNQFSPEEYLYRVGEVANEMFFVVSGSLDEIADNKKVSNTCLHMKA